MTGSTDETGGAPPAHGYSPIADYGAIGNLRTVALVSRHGSIDWCCLPDLDSGSVFGALLDARRGGRFLVRPDATRGTEQSYEPSTNVLETRFDTETGRLVLTDFMPLAGNIAGAGRESPESAVYRLLECTAGYVTVLVEWSPRLDYARAQMTIRRTDGGAIAAAEGASAGGQVSLGGLPHDADVADDEGGPVLRATIRLPAGCRHLLVTRHGDGDTTADLETGMAALEATREAWRSWVADSSFTEEHTFLADRHEQLVRSGLALKLLTHRHTGAIAAAATTSLPEVIGGVRNWDYRYTWVRDAAFTAQALFALGHRAEAVQFLDFVQRVSHAKSRKEFRLQIMYGLHGESDLDPIELPHLEGYECSRPVRVGNAAARQLQLDIFGELVNAGYELTRFGGTMDPERWQFLREVTERAASEWTCPDHGIWEMRGEPRHFVYSKLMAWVALDRAGRLATRYGLDAPVDRWRRIREEIRQAILTQGYDEQVGAFVQSFGSTALDAANLLIPVVEFLPFEDSRVQSTIDQTLKHLTRGGVVYRYNADDNLPGGEGAFGLATFWMIDALTLSGRIDEAQALFEGMAGRVNHVGLYSEEFDPRSNLFLGNFPQAFSHVGMINSALYLGHALGRRPVAPPPIGSREHRAEAGHDEQGAAV